MPDSRYLPDWIEGFMLYTDNTEPPYLFRKWTAISCVAAALQRKVKVEWGPSLTFYPNLYVILVGPSATGKGTAMRPGIKLINEISGIRTAAQATSLQALIRQLKDNNLTDVCIETGKQTYHSSMTVFSEEFTVFLGYNNRELITSLCNWYDCEDRWRYETIARKKEEIIGVWVNLIAGTTPDLIRSSLPPDSIGGGLTSRIIFIYEEKPDKLVTLPTETDKERELFQHLVHDLEQISLMSGEFKWTAGFSDLWEDWRIRDRENPPFHDPKFDGYNGRRKVHLMKLAMIISASTNHSLLMTGDDLQTAVEWLEEAEVKMALTFKGVGKSDIADLMHRAIRFFKMSKSSRIPYHIYARHFESDMDKLTMDRVLSTTEAMRFARLVRAPGVEPYIEIMEDIPDN